MTPDEHLAANRRSTPATGSALFIPLKREYYERFRDGTKAVEFRPYGPRWNERTCSIGRRVVISLGYGKNNRMAGFVQSFRVAEEHEREEIPGWAACYGPDDRRPIACIGIYLETNAEQPAPQNTVVRHAEDKA